jgi:GTP-binding protein EngB required for normal cell division
LLASSETFSSIEKSSPYSVKTLTGEAYSFEAKPSDTIAKIKKKLLQENPFLLPLKQKLIFCGKELKDHETIHDLKIQAQSVLHLVMKPMNFLLVGPSQGGKTSFIKSFLQGSQLEFPIGDNSGRSVTMKPVGYKHSFNSTTITILDTPGFGSTDLRTNKELLKAIEEGVILELEADQPIDAILLVENLTSPARNLEQNLLRLKETFGEHVTNSIIVIGTQVKKDEDNNNGERLESIKKFCETNKLQFLAYESMSNFRRKEFQHDEEGARELMRIMSSQDIKPFSHETFEQIRNEIKAIAIKLMQEEELTQTVVFPRKKKIREPFCGDCTKRKEKREELREVKIKVHNNTETYLEKARKIYRESCRKELLQELR